MEKVRNTRDPRKLKIVKSLEEVYGKGIRVFNLYADESKFKCDVWKAKSINNGVVDYESIGKIEGLLEEPMSELPNVNGEKNE